jgi:hypothetical protein
LFRASGSPSDPIWSATLIPAPPDALSVWATAAGDIRLGYLDGTVLSITGGVPLSAPLGSPVSTYAQYCGDTFALAPDGLHRLNVDAGLGTWALFDAYCSGLCLGDGGLPLGHDGGPGLDPGQIQISASTPGEPNDEAEMYLFTRFGAVARIKGTGCHD